MSQEARKFVCTLNFTVTSASFSLATGWPRFARASDNPVNGSDELLRFVINYDKPNQHGGVLINESIKLRDIDGGCEVRPRDDEPAPSEGVGTLHFNAAITEKEFESFPPSYWLTVTVPRKQFDSLVAQIRAGWFPSGLSARTEGMDLPHEFQYDWDAAKTPELKAVRFSADFGSKVDCEVLREPKTGRATVAKGYQSADKADLAKVTQFLDLQRELLGKLHGQLKFGLYLVAALLAVILLRLFS